jgi:hypothetical protein
MIKYTAPLLKFDEQGEKTGWTYIEVPAALAQKLKPGNKKSFRVKGLLDKHAIKGAALMPMGEGNFIMAINAAMRKGTGKRKGSRLSVQLELDEAPMPVSADLMACLEDEPKALGHFNKMPAGHRRYYINWIESAKTELTKAKRIAMAVNALARGLHFGLMMREQKANRDKLM